MFDLDFLTLIRTVELFGSVSAAAAGADDDGVTRSMGLGHTGLSVVFPPYS